MSGSIYALYKEIHPPTCVDHCAQAHFTSPEVTNLVIAKASMLQIYLVIEEDTVTEVETQQPAVKTQDRTSTALPDTSTMEEDENMPYPSMKPTTRTVTKMARLELVTQYRLHGVVASMGVVQTNAPNMMKGQDCLLLTFKDAKMSLLEWSSSANSIVTVSIHYYERDEYRREFMANPCPSEVRMDPQNRCAVMHFYGDKFAVLPFRQDEVVTMGDEVGSSKWPYLASFVIDGSDIDKSIKNVIDTAFLSGFFEPTIAILFEPMPTWTGRLAVRKDTCSLVIVSLDLTQRQYPIIYRLDNLPYDSFKIVPVSKPIGGILVITSNSVIHVSQSTQPIGFTVNMHAANTTAFPHLSDEHATRGLRLEGAQTAWLKPDRLLLSLRDGDLFVIELETDGRGVARFGLVKVGASVLASCTCTIGNGYFFLGSRLGDSLLIKFDERQYNDHTKFIPSQSGDLDQDLYGQDLSGPALPPPTTAGNVADNSPSKLAQFQFTVCDSLMNIGPIADFAIGEAVDGSEEFREDSNAKDYEIVTCSGYGKNGALSVLQRNVRPRVLSSFDLPGCLDIWAIRCSARGRGQSSVDENEAEALDSYLVVSRENGTLILSTDEELQELESSGFYCDGPTIAVGTVLDETRIVQVYAKGVALLNAEGKSTQLVPFTDDAKVVITAASIVDPYVLVHYTDGRIVLMKADPVTKDLTICQQPAYANKSVVTACTLFSDDTGLFVPTRDVLTTIAKKKSTPPERTSFSEKPLTSIEDDIDLDLYGDKDTDDMEIDDDQGKGDGADVVKNGQQVNEENVSGGGASRLKPTFFCLMCRQDGAIEMHSLPDFEEVFCFPHFDLAPGILADAPMQAVMNTAVAGVRITEILLLNLGREKKDAYIFASTELGDLIVYKAFRHVMSATELEQPKPNAPPGGHRSSISNFADRLAVQFSRVRYDILLREPLPEGATARQFAGRKRSASPTKETTKAMDIDDEQPLQEGNDRGTDETDNAVRGRSRRIVPFTDISGYSGVFVNGPKPVWVFLGPRRFLRMHPMNVDGPVTCFTEFHNVNCPRGFLYINSKHKLRICLLPTHVSYDLDWPARKIPIKRTAHSISHHLSTQTYTVMTSMPESFILKDDGIQAAREQEARGAFLPQVPRFTLELVSPVTWETVDRHEFASSEHALCHKACSLETKQNASGRKIFIVVGTAYNYGEDLSVKGGVYIFDVIDVVPEPDNPQTNHKLKLICAEDVKGPVSAISAVNGYLLTCIGSKVIIRSFEDNESLTGIAFIDVQVYGHTVCSLNNMILLGDMYKSVWFLGYQEEPSKLALLGKDWHPLEIMSGEFLVDGKVMYFIVSDADKNLHLFSYSPYNVQSFGGQKLIRRGDFHVGSAVSRFIRLRQRPLRSNGAESANIGADVSEDVPERHMVLGGTLDGSLNIVTPVDEKMYKRFHLLHAAMVNGLQHPAGLNPKAFRLMHSNERLASNATKGVLDGDLLSLFPSLAANRQKEMTKQIGSSVERVLDDLVQVATRVEFW